MILNWKRYFVELECNSDVSDALIEQGSGLLYILDKYYGDSKLEIDPNLSKQGADSSKVEAKAKQRAKIKAALNIVLPSVRASWKKLGLEYSRQQLRRSLFLLHSLMKLLAPVLFFFFPFHPSMNLRPHM